MPNSGPEFDELEARRRALENFGRYENRAVSSNFSSAFIPNRLISGTRFTPNHDVVSAEVTKKPVFVGNNRTQTPDTKVHTMSPALAALFTEI